MYEHCLDVLDRARTCLVAVCFERARRSNRVDEEKLIAHDDTVANSLSAVIPRETPDSVGRE
jgi:hypothetical protein